MRNCDITGVWRHFSAFHKAAFATPILLLAMLLGCSGLKLDKEANCLNQKSACFKEDKTRPNLLSSTPQAGQTVSTLDYIDIGFSEELNNPQPADFELQSPGNALTIARIEKLSLYTYRLWISGAVQNGDITFNLAKLKDYNNNFASGTLIVKGNVDIGIEFDTNLATNANYRLGVSSTGGYTSTTIRFRHDYLGDSVASGGTDANDWKVYRTTGVTACSGPGVTLLGGFGSGTLAGNTYTSITLNEATHFPGAEAYYRIVICINNFAKNKFGAQGLLIVRDNTAPTVNIAPYSTADEFRVAQSIGVSCTDNVTKLAYRVNSFNTWTGVPADPVAPLDPDFTAVGEVDTGAGSVEYLGNVATPAPSFLGDPLNPIRSKYKFRCIDKAGNKSVVSALTSPIYVIDNTLPEVTIAVSAAFREFITNSIPANNSTTINFTTNQPAGQVYKINKNGTDCNGGGTDMVSSLTPTAGTLISHTFFTGAAANQFAIGTHLLRICVRNPANTKWGVATLSVTRDDTPPIVTPSVVSGTYGSIQSVELACTDNADKVYVTTAVGLGASVPTPPSLPTLISNEELPGAFIPENDRTTIIRWICVDKAGNQSVPGLAQYTVDTIIPTVTIVSNEYSALSSLASAYQSTNLTFASSRGGLTYRIMRGTTDCVTGATQIGSDQSVPAAVNGVVPTVSVNLNYAGFPSVGTTYDLKVCVFNNASTAGYNTNTLQIKRDDTIPNVFAGIATLNNPGNGSVTVGWPTATDAFSGIGGYDVCQSTFASPGAGSCQATFTATYQAPASASSLVIGGLNPATTYYFMVRARDQAGNRESNTAERKSRLNLNLLTAGYTGPGLQVQVNTAETLIIAANGTQTFTTAFNGGAAYSLAITSQPTGQVCSIRQLQFGTITGDLTINADCVTGYMTAQSVNTVPATKLGYRLFQGKNTAIAGSGSLGSSNGTGALASFHYPEYMAHMGGALYVADTNTYKIRKVTVAGVVDDVTGSSVIGVGPAAVGTTADDRPCANAAMGQPMGVTTDGTNLYFADFDYHRIRKISDVNGTCQVTTLAGVYVLPTGGHVDGTANVAQFKYPRQIVANNDYIFVADSENNRIRRVSLSTGMVSTLAGSGAAIDANGTGAAASLYEPVGLTLIGTMLYASTKLNHIFSIETGTTNYGQATIVAGDGNAGHKDAAGLISQFNQIYAMTTDGADLYLAEVGNHVIRRIEISKNFRTTTIAGTPGAPGGDVTGVIGVNARFNVPHGLATDGRSLFVANHTAHTIRKLTDNGLVGYWPLNGSTSEYSSDGTSVKTGTISGNVAGVAGRYGESNGAYYFDGVNDAITTSTGAADTNFNAGNFTIAFWIKPAATQVEMDGAPRDYDIVTNLSSQYDFAIRYHNEIVSGATIPANTPGQIIFIRFDGTLSPYCISGRRIDDGNFHHITAQKAGGLLNFFIDGKKICSTPDTTGSITSVGPVKIGARPGFTTNDFTGALADMRIYSRALNEGEINELAQDAVSVQVGASFSTGASGLLAHYTFDQNAQTAASGPVGGLLTGTSTQVIGKDGDPSGAVHLNGSSDYYEGGAMGLPMNGAPRTLCAWVSPATQPGYTPLRYPIISYGNAQYFDLVYYDAASSGAHDFRLALTNNGAVIHETAVTLQLNTWQHVCGTNDGTQSAIYRDGVQLFLGGTAFAGPAALSNLTIGRRNNNTVFFQGKIDDVRIYNNALSPLQIRQLATQVSSGLVARYDFNGDRNDVSGFGQDLSNNGASLDVDRFGVNNASVRLVSNAYLDGTMNGFPLGAAPRTVCAWTKPNILVNGTFSEVAMYGTNGSSTGWGFGMDASGANGGRIFVLDTAGDMIYAQPHGLNIWRHVCATYDGTTEQLYLDATLVTGVGKAIGLATTVGQFYIGRGIFGTADYFNGNIDDVRVYNRVLGPNELQALQQQPNKKMQLSGPTIQGDMGGSPSGIAGADQRCSVGFKAMIVDGVNRRACSSPNCGAGITENIDWVIRANTTYVRSDAITPIGISNFNSVLPFPLMNTISSGGGVNYWTGFNTDWTGAANCLSGSGWNTAAALTNGIFGKTDQTAVGVIYNFGPPNNACDSFYNLLCVEQ